MPKLIGLTQAKNAISISARETEREERERERVCVCWDKFLLIFIGC